MTTVHLDLDQISQDLETHLSRKDEILMEEAQKMERLRNQLDQRQVPIQRRNSVTRVYQRILRLIHSIF